MLLTQSISLKELQQQNNKKFNQRGLNCILYLVDFEKDPKSTEVRYLFLLKCLEKSSNASGHIVTVKFDKDTAMGGLKSRPYNDDCHVHCQCPAFVYWGPAFNATEGGYNLDTVEDRAPDIRDPERNIKICKHISRVARMLQKMSYNSLNKRAGITAASVKSVENDLPIVHISETFPCLMFYIEKFQTNLDPQEFCSNLTRSNYESELLRIGAII